MDLGTFTVSALIVHEVPKKSRGVDGPLPETAEGSSPMSDESRNFFRERIIETLKSKYAIEVEFVAESPSPVPKGVDSLLQPTRPEDTLVSVSVAAAHYLHQSQPIISPVGLLTVVLGFLGDVPCVAILKLEKEQGARARLGQVDGKKVFEIEHLRELMLTGKTRVFKASLFWYEQRDGENGIRGLASDEQRSFRTHIKPEVADFYLSFLGCQPLTNPRQATKKVFSVTENFINQKIEDPLRRAKYHQALLVEMSSNEATFVPSAFATKHFETPDRSAYRTFLTEQELTPNQALLKDTELIVRRIRDSQLSFAEGVRLIVPPGEMGKSVVLDEKADGRTEAKVTGHLKNVEGK